MDEPDNIPPPSLPSLTGYHSFSAVEFMDWVGQTLNVINKKPGQDMCKVKLAETNIVTFREDWLKLHMDKQRVRLLKHT